MFFLFSALAVLILMGMGKNVHQAVQLLVNFWKSIFIDFFNELFGKRKDTYPLIFGTGYDGRVYPELVDAEFDGVYRLFDQDSIFYYGSDFSSLDVVGYAFSIYVDAETEDIGKLHKKINRRLEVMVNRRFKDCGIYDILPSPFIYHEFNNEENPTLLRVYFARTQNGTVLINNRKHMRLREQQQRKRDSSVSFETDWKSEEGKDTND